MTLATAPLTSPSPALATLRRSGLSIGVEFPLDNDFARQSRAKSSTQFGIPDLTHHRRRAELADQLGFRALWLRDVPLWVPAFGDAGQVFDPFPYLGYLAGVTDSILLGTAAVVLPLRHPLHVAKMAASIDQLSGGRLILGVASGDRPIEYPAFDADFESRGERFRSSVDTIRTAWRDSSDPEDTVKVLPPPAQNPIPLVAVGRAQQTTDWIASTMDGYMTYHRPGGLMKPVVNRWNRAVPDGQGKPLLTTMLVDLAEDPGAPPEPIRFGARLGRNSLVRYLGELEESGVGHVALNFRPSTRPIEDALEEVAKHVLPAFS
ncbi:luciferase-type oxidoreductase [Pseudarthrobacter sp. PvP004]|uniref:LLM class oxidoreductase n=1 Tax=Pseudarthrobacter sp. PvP004 TaxID=2817850 RepID=UPI001AE9B169|nr:LLM class oxidoreductase [Pseudarthrobacter sp. PvP004]MBP2267337.1 luciferase-type oxidoreductase [Pseudarthrobacter sp. PvP004]